MSLDLFGERPRRPRRIMAHFTDVGSYQAEFECSTCGWKSGWIDAAEMSVSDIKRGIPCEECNKGDRDNEYKN